MAVSYPRLSAGTAHWPLTSVAEVSGDVLLDSRERYAVDPSVDVLQLLGTQAAAAHRSIGRPPSTAMLMLCYANGWSMLWRR